MPGGPVDFKITMGLVGAANIATGIQSILNMGKQVIDFVAKQAREVQAYTRVVQGHTVSVAAADAATSGLIDTLQLHRQAARLESAGLRVTSEQYRSIAVAAGQYAQRTGVDMTQAMEQLTSAVISGNERGLRPFNVTLGQGGTVVQRQTRALEGLTARFADQRVEIQNTGDAIYQLQNTWGTAWSEMVATVERSSGPLRTILESVNSWIADIASSLETQRRAAERLSRMGNETRMRDIEQELRGMHVDPNTGQPFTGGGALQEARRFIDRTGMSIVRTGRALAQGDLITAGREFAGSDELARQRTAALIAEYDRLQHQDIQELADGGPVIRPSAAQRANGSADTGRGGRGSRRDPLVAIRANEDSWTQLFEHARAAQDRINEKTRDSAEDAIVIQLDAYRRMYDDMMKMAEEEAEHAEEMNARKAESVELAIKREQEALEERQATIENMEALGSAIATTSSIFSEMGDIAEMVSGKESAAAEVIKKVKGGLAIAENVVGAATQIAKAVAAAAEQNYGQAVLHGLAAALHIAAAAKAAAELGTGGKSASVSKGAASAGSGSRRSMASPEYKGGPRENTQAPQVINIHNSVVTSNRVNEDLRNMERDSSRRAA